MANDGELCSAVQFYRVSLSGGPGTSDITLTRVVSSLTKVGNDLTKFKQTSF